MTKVYQLVVVEDPGRPWHAACTIQVNGSTLNSLGLGEGRGIGMGCDPADAAHDAMCSAELSLPDKSVLDLRARARQDPYE